MQLHTNSYVWKLLTPSGAEDPVLYFIYRFSPYRAVNTLRLCYKNQSVNAVQGNNRCLF
jgi:hypothetical protein